MIVKCKAYCDGDHYIGVPIFDSQLPPKPEEERPKRERRMPRFSDRQMELFGQFYKEAQTKAISKKKMADYIISRDVESCDISDWFTMEDVLFLIKRQVANFHKRKKRYERKIYLNSWNWFVTFTYDDEKETEESFYIRLKKTLSNFHTRHGWKYIGVWERGSKSDRLHFHVILYIPAGEMPGKLFVDRKWSTKRKRMETFTNNTYFQKRFGQSAWESITEEDLQGGSVRNYLLKYLQKSDESLIYSRGIPSELEVEIDTERDVILNFRQFVPKLLLNPKLFGWIPQREKECPTSAFVFEPNEFNTHDFEDVPII